MDPYFDRYLKYKTKYLELKNQVDYRTDFYGGGNEQQEQQPAQERPLQQPAQQKSPQQRPLQLLQQHNESKDIIVLLSVPEFDDTVDEIMGINTTTEKKTI